MDMNWERQCALYLAYFKEVCKKRSGKEGRMMGKRGEEKGLIAIYHSRILNIVRKVV